MMYKDIIHARINALRLQMKREEIDYYLVVTADYHSSEYVSDYFKCREFLSGFTGSNGDLLVWQEGAALWTDGRYFTQAAEELEGTGITLMKMGEKNVPTIEEFLEMQMLPGQVLATDGRCIPLYRGKQLQKTIKVVASKACADANNPMRTRFVWNMDLSDKIWEDRPSLPSNKAWLLSSEYTGEDRSVRMSRVRSKMSELGADAMLVSSLDDIAWLMLLRGNDIEYNPVALAYLIMSMDKAFLYIDAGKLGKKEKDCLEADGIFIRDYNLIASDLKNIRDIAGAECSILFDENRVSYALYKFLEEGIEVCDGVEVSEQLPTVLMKSVKTEREIENEKAAHIKDGVAVTKLLYYLDVLRNDSDFLCGDKKVTELEIAEKLLNFRKEQADFIEESFAPIIATGAHGAIIHYEPTKETDASIEKDTFLLMDTGAQFMQGTTDITRTVCMGEASDEMKRDFTAVLRGHLALMNAIFPDGTTGPNLDILARKALWENGLDYRHGTGHGVGFLLNVHEGPQNINQKGIRGKLGTAFKPGMITSDEPGVYHEGRYGIRTENMILCKEALESEYGDFFSFETLTLVPYDRRSIDFSLMSKEDIDSFNKYNALVRSAILPHLNEEEREWLICETEPFL